MTLSLKEIIETEIYEQGRDQGLEQGRVSGLELGKREGERQMLVTFAELRFGRLSDGLRAIFMTSKGDPNLLSQEIINSVDAADLGRRLSDFEA